MAFQKRKDLSPVLDTTTPDRTKSFAEPDDLPLPKKVCTDDTQKNYAGTPPAATPFRDDANDDLLNDLEVGHYDFMIGNESPVNEDRHFSSLYEAGSGYTFTPTRTTNGRHALPNLAASFIVVGDQEEAEDGGQFDSDNDHEEEEEEDHFPSVTSNSHFNSLSGKHVRRSLLHEMLSSNLNKQPEEEVHRQRRKSASLVETILFDTDDDKEEDDKKDDADDNDENDEGTTMEDKTTLPLSHSYIRPAPGRFDEEAAQFFSSVDDDMSKEPPEFEIAPAYKISLLQEQSRNPRPWTTDWPHFFSDDYFDKYKYESRTVITDQDKELQPYTNNNTVYTYFESEYHLLGLLDSGEYAQVFKVSPLDTPLSSLYASAEEEEDEEGAKETDEREKKPILCSAVKKSKLMFTGWDDRWQQLIEVHHLQQLRNSNHCIRMHKAWEERGYLYIELELCSGGSLDKFLKHHHRKIDEATVWQIFYELVLGINEIHNANIAHLDLKPANILIDDEGCIKIGDFGTSMHVPADIRWVRGEGDRRYMAPDLLRDHFGLPADIFSLGIILLELATGMPPLPDTDEAWEMLRLSDLSSYKGALAHTSAELIAMIEWLITAETQRPKASDIIQHPAFEIHEKSSTSLIAYATEMKNVQQKMKRPNGLARTHTFRSVDDTSSIDEPIL